MHLLTQEMSTVEGDFHQALRMSFMWRELVNTSKPFCICEGRFQGQEELCRKGQARRKIRLVNSPHGMSHTHPDYKQTQIGLAVHQFCSSPHPTGPLLWSTWCHQGPSQPTPSASSHRKTPPLWGNPGWRAICRAVESQGSASATGWRSCHKEWEQSSFQMEKGRRSQKTLKIPEEMRNPRCAPLIGQQQSTQQRHREDSTLSPLQSPTCSNHPECAAPAGAH